MSAVRHHTVARFLLERFAVDRGRGPRVCQLDKRTGRPRQVGPRDATIEKHFYSIDIDGRRDPVVEETLGKIENVAAPLIGQLAAGEFPERERRAELALFIAMSWLRTPAWRQQTKALYEQMTLAVFRETHHLDPNAIRRAMANSEFASMTDEELEALRKEIVEDIDGGGIGVEMPVNLLIKTFLESTTHAGWAIFAMNWTLVRPEQAEFILADTPSSQYDPTPMFPGGGVGLMSSPNAQLLLPLGPKLGVLVEPKRETFEFIRDHDADLREMGEEERAAAFTSLEGEWAEGVPTREFVEELNLRSYAHAQRFIFGSQKAVCDTHAAAKRNATRRIAVSPVGGRVHMVEDDPERGEGAVKITRTFKA
jgi:Protein of unknown function (DUF4238)